MYRSLKRRIKGKLIDLSRRHLALYPDPPSTISELGHPLGLITKLGMTCRGVIHVGANRGQEFESYRRAGLASVIYIEPIPDVFAKLRDTVSVDPRHRSINALCSDRSGEEVDFNISSNEGLSSSIFELGSHSVEHPEVTFCSRLRLKTMTLDDIIFGTKGVNPKLLDCLVIDVQGAEIKVLAGAQRTLQMCNFIFTEVSQGDLYKGGANIDEVVALLRNSEFTLNSLDINRHGWGNAFFIKRGASKRLVRNDTI
jgi:FkbM family methyltransferase